MSVRIQTSQNVELEYEPASIGDRILATVLDRLIYAGWVLTWILIYSRLKLNDDITTFFIILLVALPVMFYPILTEYFLNGQTLGKRAMNIRVVLLDGNQATLGAYILRWLLILVDTEILTPLVAIVTIAANGKGQRLGDIAAGTTVIKTVQRVNLSQVTYQTLPEDYQVTYLQASRLNDRDIETIRQVLHKRNEGLIQRTAEKVGEVIGVKSVGQYDLFLMTIINDYAYLAAQDAA